VKANVRPDAERECEHGHSGEARVLQELAQSIAKVIHGSLSVVNGRLSVASCLIPPLIIHNSSFIIRSAAPPLDRLSPHGAPGPSRQLNLRPHTRASHRSATLDRPDAPP